MACLRNFTGNSASKLSRVENGAMHGPLRLVRKEFHTCNRTMPGKKIIQDLEVNDREMIVRFVITAERYIVFATHSRRKQMVRAGAGNNKRMDTIQVVP